MTYNTLMLQYHFPIHIWKFQFINLGMVVYHHALSTKNACRVYHVASVSKMGLALLITFLHIYRVACVELAHSSLGDWKNIFITYLIIIIKPEVWILNHCLGLGHETMVCAVCLTIFLWICDMTRLLRGTFHVLVVFAPNLVLCHLACSIAILLGTLLTSDT